MGDVELLEEFLQGLPAADLVQIRAGLEHGHHVFLDRQAPEHGCLLRQVAHAQPGPAVHRQAREIFLVQMDASLVTGDEADDHVKGGCLAGAVGA